MSVISRFAGDWQLLRARFASGFRPQHPHYSAPLRRWLVLQKGANPSTDYYVRPRVEASGLPVVVRDLSEPPQAGDLAAGTNVVVVRYLDPAWARALSARQEQLAGVTYFMDDDLLDPAAWAGLPAPYYRRLTTHFNRMGPHIAALCSDYWVSTPALQARHPALQAQVMPPLPLPEDRPRRSPMHGHVRIFYHGTEAHLAEMRWLRPIIAEVLEDCPQAHFEIIGGHEVNRLYRDLPRTRVLHPMTWPNFLAHCRTMQGHIGLAPLLPSSFNAGRSATKVMDIARCGAVGVFSDVPVYAAARHAGGLLLPAHPRRWVDALVTVCREYADRQAGH